MAISLQRVIRCTSCLVLGYFFQGRRIEWRYIWLHQIQDGGRQPSWIISICATSDPIHFGLYSAHRSIIFAIAQLSCYEGCGSYMVGINCRGAEHPFMSYRRSFLSENRLQNFNRLAKFQIFRHLTPVLYFFRSISTLGSYTPSI